ncbi:MAG TPA: hypothetical protein VLU73_09125, partial [Methylococcaceae bacterium]|nr:hypothetical protein [Methylococcaceae bacterium]
MTSNLHPGFALEFLLAGLLLLPQLPSLGFRAATLVLFGLPAAGFDLLSYFLLTGLLLLHQLPNLRFLAGALDLLGLPASHLELPLILKFPLAARSLWRCKLPSPESSGLITAIHGGFLARPAKLYRLGSIGRPQPRTNGVLPLADG